MDAGIPLFNVVWAVVYELGFYLLWSATPGKRLLGIYVGEPNASRVSAPRAVIRVATFHFLFHWVLHL